MPPGDRLGKITGVDMRAPRLPFPAARNDGQRPWLSPGTGVPDHDMQHKALGARLIFQFSLNEFHFLWTRRSLKEGLG